MLLNVLTEQDTYLLAMALDLSLTEQERSAYQLKVFARIISQKLCKHSIKIVTDDASKISQDNNSILSADAMREYSNDTQDIFTRAMFYTVELALRQAEERHAAEKAEQAREIAALKEQLAQHAQSADAPNLPDQAHSSHLHKLDPDVEVWIADEDVRCGGSGRSMTSEAFCKRVEDVAGRWHWRTAFAHHAGITVQALKGDLQGDTLPDRLTAVLDTLRADDLLPASWQHWTDEERVRLSMLLGDGVSDVELAHRLSTEFGRRIFAGGVARQRRRLQRLSGTLHTSASQRARHTAQHGRGRGCTIAAGHHIA